MDNTKTSVAVPPFPTRQQQEVAKEKETKCPFLGGDLKRTVEAKTNQDWWPNQLNLKALHQNSPLSDPMGEAFDYTEEFKSLDLNAVIQDLHALMTKSQ